MVPVILVILGLQLFHPNTNTITSALAQIGINFAILAPLLWVARLPIREQTFTKLIGAFWAFHCLSAFVGLLQVYFPGRFQPPVSQVIGELYHDSLKISLNSGADVFRPMGLTDMPGGAATAGMYSTIFGLVFFLTGKSTWVRGVALGGVAIGLFCIYLSQVRSVLIMTGICCCVFLACIAYRGDWRKALFAGGMFVAVLLSSFAWAVAVGGEAVTDRLSTLVEADMGEVYYSNRGRFLETTVNDLLPQYPLGAGLGRWGMMHRYFGNSYDPNSPPLWAEIMWTGWLLDGGIPLLLAYPAAIAIACWFAWRTAIFSASGQLSTQAAAILAYNVGAIAITFNYPYFIGQGGLEFWLLNAALFGAVQHAKKRAAWEAYLAS
ncbi:O-antigen ligase family protein [Blastopirellula retiformator]|nr:hypothetical protein [Blastopirellula retiformator]